LAYDHEKENPPPQAAALRASFCGGKISEAGGPVELARDLVVCPITVKLTEDSKGYLSDDRAVGRDQCAFRIQALYLRRRIKSNLNGE